MADRPPDVDEATEEYFYNLVAVSPEAEEILAKMREGLWAQTLFRSTTTLLSPDEKGMLFDRELLPWDDLNSEILMLVAIHRATNLENAKICAKKLTAAKLAVYDKFQESYYPDSVKGDAHKEMRWRSALRAMAIDFARELEFGSVRQGGDMNEIIAKILNESWAPPDAAHAQAIYYVAGSVLQMLKNLSERSKSDEVRSALSSLGELASTTKQSARELQLPSERVESKEKVRLTYANSLFYDCLLKIESVYHKMLSDRNVALFGVGIVGDIGYVLESFQDATGFSRLVPQSASAGTKDKIFRAILESYSNTRGKDFAYKKNATAAVEKAQTLRAKLAVSAALAKERRARAKAEAKETAKSKKAAGKRAAPKAAESASGEGKLEGSGEVVSGCGLKPPTEGGEGKSVEDGHPDPAIGLRVEVKYDEGLFEGSIGSVEPGDDEGTFKILVKWDCGDPDDEFVYPCPEGDIKIIDEGSYELAGSMTAPSGDSEFCDVPDSELSVMMENIEGQILKKLNA